MGANILTSPSNGAEAPMPALREARSAIRPGRRALLISYHFPPVGGAGVQRPVKFAKYLRRFGWEVSVLVAENPSVPVTDTSLVADIPRDTIVWRAKSWEPGYKLKQGFASPEGQERRRRSLTAAVVKRTLQLLRSGAGTFLQPDPQVLWLPSALRAGIRLLELLHHDAIVATAPAYTNLLLGAMLKGRFGLPLLLDFRDEWDISTAYLENSPNSRITHAVQSRMQNHVLRQADAIVATTEASARRLKERARAAGGQAAAYCIYNGFDPDDFASMFDPTKLMAPRDDAFHLVYTGTLWNLTSVEPLVRAVELINARSPELLTRLCLTFVGRTLPAQQDILARLRRTRCTLRLEDYCDHMQSLAWMGSADALCLLLSDLPEADRVVPAKLFEYMATRKEILAIVPDGEAADILRRLGMGSRFRPDNSEGVARWLQDRIMGVRPPAPAGGTIIEQFTRERLCGQMARLLDDLVLCEGQVLPRTS